MAESYDDDEYIYESDHETSVNEEIINKYQDAKNLLILKKQYESIYDLTDHDTRISFETVWCEYESYLIEPSHELTIEIVDNDIFHWKVRIKQFDAEYKLCLDMITYGIDEVVLDIKFKHKLYPHYPPSVILESPRLQRCMFNYVTNYYLLNFDNWKTTTSITTIINHMNKFIQKYGYIDNTFKPYTTLEKYLLRLSLLTGDTVLIQENEIASILAQEESKWIEANYTKKTIQIDKQSSNHGVGYGNNSAKYTESWNIDKYRAIQDERNTELNNIISLIQDDIMTLLIEQNINDCYDIIANSCLFTSINNTLKHTTLLELDEQNFMMILNILHSLSQYSIFNTLFTMLHDSIKLINNQFNIIAKKIDNNDKLYTLVLTYHPLIQHLYQHVSNITISNITISNISESKSESLEEQYIKIMKDLQLIELDDIVNFSLTYKVESVQRGTVQRIIQEMTTLMSSLPLSLSSSIWIRTSSNNILTCQALISGPDDTPYSGGLYLFDILFSNNYPNTSPKVILQTTGYGTVRFNPNLYNCGKVCLSLLGTWSGHESEKWNPQISTLLQVLVSISSLILVAEPYFNEPGYQNSQGTPNGDKYSLDYNKNIRKQNVRYGMIEHLKNPPIGFEDVVHNHFMIQKDIIKTNITKWMNEDSDAITEWSELLNTFIEKTSNLIRISFNISIFFCVIVSFIHSLIFISALINNLSRILVT